MIDLSTARVCWDEDIDDVMAYHSWDAEKVAKGKLIRDILGEALRVIIEKVPPSPDRDSAIRKLREVRMDCNSALTFDGKL